ncbi:hypothetical protein COCNU_09G002170 [Cocos nucifera]|uniref:Uncharacterized protein n=1 Tax=Cocos nucifera TaxID=13894 RepID=A0A8K0N742_COCNU|nr:hypothetical protein COCNU_09G002170 [Cocos nucifera]
MATAAFAGSNDPDATNYATSSWDRVTDIKPSPPQTSVFQGSISGSRRTNWTPRIVVSFDAMPQDFRRTGFSMGCSSSQVFSI